MGDWLSQLYSSNLFVWAILVQPLLVYLVLLRWSFRLARLLWMKIVAAVTLAGLCITPFVVALYVRQNSPPGLRSLERVSSSVAFWLSFLPIVVLPLWLVRWAFRANRSQAVKIGAVCAASLCWGGMLVCGCAAFVLSSFTSRFAEIAGAFFFLPYYAVLIGPTAFVIGWAVGVLVQPTAHKPFAMLASGLVLVMFGWWAVQQVSDAVGLRPLARPEKPYVQGGRALIRKEPFFDAPEWMGSIMAISSQSCEPSDPDALTVTSSAGFALISRRGALRTATRFEHEDAGAFRALPVDVDGDGVCEFVDRAGGWSPVGLRDHQGRIRWYYGDRTMGANTPKRIDSGAPPLDIMPFHAMDNGQLAFLIPLQAAAGPEAHLVSATGEVLRKVHEYFWGSRAVDLDGDGRDELVSMEIAHDRQMNGYQLTIRNGMLEVIKRFPVGLRAADNAVRLVRWPDLRGAWHAVLSGRDTMSFVDLRTGDVSEEIPLNTLRIPGLSVLDQAMPVRFAADREPFLVVARVGKPESQFVGRAILSIYDPHKTRIYEEILRGGERTLLVLPSDGGAERLLLDECEPGTQLCVPRRIWQYSLQPPY